MRVFIILLILCFTSNVYASQQTLGAHDITGNLSVDTNTLFVDATTNNVGIGSTDPVQKLDVNGNIYGSSGIRLNQVTKTGTYTATTSDYTIFASGTFTVTLYTAVGNGGRLLYVKNINTGTITVDGNGAETIDGDATIDLIQDETITIVSDGANWRII